ncbi:hypothetical protein LP420_06005 [Massilia sp. B-10]|nr:hypothetical protein LP420_06005 [Massilia sp. B-10]
MSLQYHLARLAIAEGRVKQADSAVTALLKAPLATTTRNRLLRMKMVTAPTAEASLAAGPRMLLAMPGASRFPTKASAHRPSRSSTMTTACICSAICRWPPWSSCARR